MSTTPLSTDRKQFLLDVFITALEGGIGYWSLASEYHPDNIDGFYAVIHEITDDDDDPEGVIHKPDRLGILPGDYYKATPRMLNAETIQRGVDLFTWHVQGIIDGDGQQVPLADIKPFPRDSYHWQFVQANLTNGQEGDYDAFTADMIVQFALFGTVVYG